MSEIPVKLIPAESVSINGSTTESNTQTTGDLDSITTTGITTGVQNATTANATTGIQHATTSTSTIQNSTYPSITGEGDVIVLSSASGWGELSFVSDIFNMCRISVHSSWCYYCCSSYIWCCDNMCACVFPVC